MSRLIAMIDEYRDTHGQPSDASIARQLGIAPQTLNSWRNRGMKEIPRPKTLQSLARLLNKTDVEIYYVVGVDTGHIVEVVAPADSVAPTKPA